MAGREGAATGGGEGMIFPTPSLLSRISLHLWRDFAPYIPRKALTNFGIQQGLLALRERYCNLSLCEFCSLKS